MNLPTSYPTRILNKSGGTLLCYRGGETLGAKRAGGAEVAVLVGILELLQLQEAQPSQHQSCPIRQFLPSHPEQDKDSEIPCKIMYSMYIHACT